MIDDLYSDPRQFIESHGVDRFLRICAGVTVKQGDRMPEGYGIAWALWDCDAYVCAPMPWNVWLGFGYRLWCLLKRGFWKAPATELEEAYQRGHDAAWRQCDIHLRVVKAQHEEDLRRLAQRSIPAQDHTAALELLRELQGEIIGLRQALLTRGGEAVH